VVFFVETGLHKGSLREGAGAGGLPRATEGECVDVKFNQIVKSRRLLPPLSRSPASACGWHLGGRLLRAVPLRIVGSGFCPMVRGLPRAMLALDASVGKSKKQTLVES